MPFNVGPMELVIVLVIALIVLGPEAAARGRHARSATGMREFKDVARAATPRDDDDDEYAPLERTHHQA